MASVDRPLIIEAEGRDQDERAALCAAVLRLLNRSDRRRVTDLHVFELIKYVHRLDRSKSGAQLSHYQIAETLFVEVRTARAILARAIDELGLLLKIEQRYVTNGQQANRYQIDWQRVRAINRGDVGWPSRPSAPSVPGDTTCHPPDTTCQGPDTVCHPPDTTCHPYKDTHGFIPELIPESPPTPNASRACVGGQEEEVVLSNEPRRSLDAGRIAPGELVLVRTARPAAGVLAPDQLALAFRQANVYDATELLGWLLPEVGREYLQRLLEYWTANKHRFDGAGALRVRLKRSRPDLPIAEGWPPPRPAPSPPPKRKTDAEIAAERQAFETAKAEALAAAAVDEPLAVQLQRRREQMLGGASTS